MPDRPHRRVLVGAGSAAALLPTLAWVTGSGAAAVLDVAATVALLGGAMVALLPPPVTAGTRRPTPGTFLADGGVRLGFVVVATVLASVTVAGWSGLASDAPGAREVASGAVSALLLFACLAATAHGLSGLGVARPGLPAVLVFVVLLLLGEAPADVTTGPDRRSVLVRGAAPPLADLEAAGALVAGRPAPGGAEALASATAWCGAWLVAGAVGMALRARKGGDAGASGSGSTTQMS